MSDRGDSVWSFVLRERVHQQRQDFRQPLARNLLFGFLRVAVLLLQELPKRGQRFRVGLQEFFQRDAAVENLSAQKRAVGLIHSIRHVLDRFVSVDKDVPDRVTLREAVIQKRGVCHRQSPTVELGDFRGHDRAGYVRAHAGHRPH